MAQNGAGATRSSRALTLQTTFPSKEHATGVERHLHLRHHRQHRSQQISAIETQSAIQPSIGNQLVDLLSPSKIAVNNISHLGSKNASFSAAGSLRGASRDPSRERGTSERSPKVMSKEYSWDEINKERRRNHQREKTLATNYASLATTVQNQSHALNSLQSSLATTLASAGKLLAQLRDLYQSSTRSHDTLTRTSIPHLTQTSETHLAALQRAHVSNSIAQLATLKARVARARERTTVLQHRVETCAQRAAVEEERERAEMRSHKRRIGLLWSLLAGLVLAWIAAAVWRGSDLEVGRERWDEAEITRGNQELRDTLRSKGLEWAMDDGLPPGFEHSGGPEPEVERRYGSPRSFGTRQSVGELPKESGKANGRLDERLEQIFDNL